MAVQLVRPVFNLADPPSLARDLDNIESEDVKALDEAFKDDAKANPDFGPLPVVTGWNDVTPEIAVNLLRRNRRNRYIKPQTCIFYAVQMKRGEWKPTGQPILIDANGMLADAQHRLYGVLLSGTTIKTFVVTDIEPFDNLFAYIDNALPRNAAAALETAGFNGVSNLIGKVIKVAEEVKYNVYNQSGPKKLPRMAPVEYVNLTASYTNAPLAAHKLTSDWRDVMVNVGSKRSDVMAYLAMRIMDLHGDVVAEDFFEELSDTTTLRQTDDPILVLQKMADKDRISKKPMKRHHFLGGAIKVFNAWHTQQTLPRGCMMRVNEDLPLIDGAPLPQVTAA